MAEELEANVISRMQAGDTTAFRKVLDHHLAQLMAYATRMTGSVTDAEDIVQETFVALWKTRERYDPKKAKLSTWLHRIAHNQYIDSYRRASARTISIDEDVYPAGNHLEDQEPDSVLETNARNEAVSRALMQLDERQRSALVMTHYQGLSHREVAEILELSKEALESMLRRSRKRMKDILVNS